VTAKRRPVVCENTFAEYREIDAVNWSTLRAATRSALAYRYACSEPVTDTDAMRLGRATHTAVFEPDRLLQEYVIWEGGRRAGKEWDAFREMHPTRTVLKPDDYDRAIDIRDAVRGHKAAAKLLRTGTPECTLTWTDAETGVACKSRLDWLGPRGRLVDLKTTRDIESRAFGRHGAAMLYHCQFAFAAMGLRANGVKNPTVRIIAVEQEPPHDVAVYRLSDDVLWAGEVKVRAALALVAECRHTGKWPGRYPDERAFDLPGWEYPEDDTNTLGDVGDWMVMSS